MTHKEVDDPLAFVTSLTDTYGPKLQAAFRSVVKLCGPVVEGRDLVDLLCSGIAHVESVMIDLKTDLGVRIGNVPSLGCELTNVGAAVDEIMAVHDQTAGTLRETGAWLERAKAKQAEAADQGRLFETTKTKLAIAETRIEAYHTDRSKVLNMFEL